MDDRTTARADESATNMLPRDEAQGLPQSNRASSASVMRKDSGVSKPRYTSRQKASGTRGSGYTEAELDSLLDSIEKYYPVSSRQWELVHQRHAKTWPTQNRNTEGLKRKFAALWKTLPSTGDPNIPPRILRAKPIHGEIGRRSGIGGDVDDDLDLPNVFADNDGDPLSQTPTQGPLPVTQRGNQNEGNVVVPSDDECAMRVSLEGTHARDAADSVPSFSPRPISRRRSRDASRSQAGSVMEMMQLQLQIDSQRIQEQREDRAERLRLWELEQKAKKEREDADRDERRERAEREEKRHSELMTFMMLSFGNNMANKSNESSGPSNK